MAVAELIGAAIGVLLLVMVAYLLVGSTLSTAELVTTAQKDVTLQQEARMHTLFSLTDHTYNSSMIVTNISNTGTETIGDLNHMDVLVYDAGSSYRIYPYLKDSTAQGSWSVANTYGEFIHPYQMDPGETYQVRINLITGASPVWFQVTSANGVYASAPL
jgi:archaeal flagellar protein FlaF